MIHATWFAEAPGPRLCEPQHFLVPSASDEFEAFGQAELLRVADPRSRETAFAARFSLKENSRQFAAFA